MRIDQLTLRDYRCFHGEQTVPIAPLTLLVGENSTGKTSFLSLIRVLWEVAYSGTIPDFKENPYDLGSFLEIAHHRGGGGGRAERFEAGFRLDVQGADDDSLSFSVAFEPRGTAPTPVERRLENELASVKVEQLNGSATYTTSIDDYNWTREYRFPTDENMLSPMYLAAIPSDVAQNNGAKPTDDQISAVEQLTHFTFRVDSQKPFASAPVRSKPRRTYDPSRPSRDPEGDYVPMYLAHLFRRQNKKEWNTIKSKLERFGSAAGLFDEVHIRSLGPRESEPFQVQVRKLGKRTKGPLRNLIDVGYGVSQVLPLVTELLRSDAPSMFLLQQPEVHLHPSAQAALGTLFCTTAQDHQLIVETHSDHLINRVRMDVRDKVTSLAPDDISILYFERNELEVNIHPLRIDESGNVLDAPASYGNFFVTETNRSLGL